MPDCTQLAKETMAILTAAAPYLISVGQGVGQQFGVETVNKAKQLLAMIRDRFRQDKNGKAEQTLELFLEDTDTFQTALNKLLAQTLTQHPEWASEVQRLLADKVLQKIITTNYGKVSNAEITNRRSGNVDQRVEAHDYGEVRNVKITNA